MAISKEDMVNNPDQFAWFAPELPSLTRAIYLTLAYADIFHYPLRIPEIHRRLIGVHIPLPTLRSYLLEGKVDPQSLYKQGGMYALAGSEEIITTRKTRARLAKSLWPEALNYGRIIARLPFVRMISVTGALAVDNVEPGTDLDYFIVTEPGHLWTCRAWTIALVRLAAMRGIAVCPNYFISEKALLFQEQNLYTAHEMIQMVPIFGYTIYQTIRRDNAWSFKFLPNAIGPPDQIGKSIPTSGQTGRLLERPFHNGVGRNLERWEMKRKIRKFSRHNGNLSESTFSADWCKGHFDQHGKYTLAALEARLRSLEGAL